MVELLLKNGADVLKPNRHGDAPIHIACKYSRVDILKVLLAYSSCNPDQLNAREDTSLHIMCRKGGNSEQMMENAKMVELLLKNGADVLKPNRHGDAPIHIACKYSRVDILKVLLAYSSCNPDQLNAHEDTSLHIVCRKGGNSEQTMENTKMVELLLKNGADILKPDRLGDAPIHIACKYSRVDILKVLLAYSSCNPDQLNAHEDTSLHIVCRKGGNIEQMMENAKMVELLLKNGADILKPNRHGDAPIHIACRYSRVDILKVLLAYSSCNPDQLNAYEDTSLHIVCRKGGNSEQTMENTKMVELLLKNGADILKPDRLGDAPIHIACKHFRVDILKTILAYRSCNTDQVNADGDTALLIASRVIQNSKIVELLLKKGANVLKLEMAQFTLHANALD